MARDTLLDIEADGFFGGHGGVGGSLGDLADGRYRGPPVDPSQRPFHELYSDNELAIFMQTALGIVCMAMQRFTDVERVLERAPKGQAHKPPDERYLLRQMFISLMHPWLGVDKLASLVKLERTAISRAHRDFRLWCKNSPTLEALAESLAHILEGVPNVILTADEGMAAMAAGHAKQRSDAREAKRQRREAAETRRGIILAGQEQAAALLIIGKCLSEVAAKTGRDKREIGELYCRLTASGQMMEIRNEARARSGTVGSKPTPLDAVLSCVNGA